ncbi:simple sugar transport system permease protein [Leucobacter exalbidus]|uniref:Simple sugar transport system permease protein n=1 Tax=Leucobacter exalbidus TaxID=662960 RepID=A0A940PS33_9MICO|nr:ABC transporter permease [Leucobacter exalbidus]MBP1325753.1 simple sugar transport system permease protein [Leucobacter exalbidus]
MKQVTRIGRWFTTPIPISVVLALVIGACFMLIAGVDPISGYVAMVQGSFGSGPGLANTISRAIPIIGIGLAIAIAFRAGILNLGTEGQAGLGALAGGMVAVYVPGPAFLIVILAFITAIAVGAAWGVIAALLENRLGVPILLSSLLMNYPARFFSSWVIRFKLDEPDSALIASEAVRPEVQMSMLVPRDSAFAETLRTTLGPTNPITSILTSVNWSLVVLIVVLIGVIFMNQRTRFGFESGVSGQNAEFARYSGVKPAPLVTRTMAFSGGLAGMFGLMLIIGAPSTRLLEGYIVQTNYAFTALLVTLLALYRPIGTAIAGIFFAAIMVGSDAMGRELGLSPQIAAVIQALVIILLAFRVGLPKLRKRGGDPDREAPPAPEPAAPAAAAAAASAATPSAPIAAAEAAAPASKESAR